MQIICFNSVNIKHNFFKQVLLYDLILFAPFALLSNCFINSDTDVELGDTRSVAEALARSKQG